MRRRAASHRAVLECTFVAAVALAAASCGRGERPARAHGARSFAHRAIVQVDRPGSTDPASGVPLLASETLRAHASERLTSLGDVLVVPDEEVVAARRESEGCAAQDRKRCEAEVAAATESDWIVTLGIARPAPDRCTLAVALDARGKHRAAPAAQLPCAKRELLAALDRALAGIPELEGIAATTVMVPVCDDRCDAGARSCRERYTLECADGDWDGCREWLPTACGAGEGCTRGKCVADPPEMGFVSEGPFRMGSAPEELNTAMTFCQARQYDCARSWWKIEQPAHWISISGFWLDRTEVTNAAYEKCVKAGRCKAVSATSCRSWDVKTRQWVTGVVDASITGAAKPVTCVSWDEARAYCAWAGKRLPTEAEWEKAARGTDGRVYPWGNVAWDGRQGNACDARCGEIAGKGWRAEAQDDGHALLADAGSYPAGASPYGILDLAGNVWEWVADTYGEDYYVASERQDPRGPGSGDSRVVRGGSWSNEPDSLRSAYRYELAPTLRMSTVGFRCAYP